MQEYLTKLYVVANAENKFLKKKSYMGWAEYTTELSKARVYPKIGSARGIATTLNKTKPGHAVYSLNVCSVERT